MTIASSRFPPPTSWNVFEDICRDAFGARWSNPNLTKHGRQGQHQHGVDIYGSDHAGNFVGIQCKNTSSPITSGLVAAEVTNAEKFEPLIAKFYIATTSDTDATLQQYVRRLSSERISQGKFGVEIVSWPEIFQDLAKNPALVAKHYPQHFPVAVSNSQLGSDAQSLKRLLEVMELDALDDWLTWGAKYIHLSVLEHLNRIEAVRNSPTFAINDPQILLMIDELVKEWLELRRRMDFAQYNLNPNGMLVFHMPGDACQTAEDEKAYAAINVQLSCVRSALHAFCNEVKRNYHEIDLVETSHKAGQLYT